MSQKSENDVQRRPNQERVKEIINKREVERKTL